MVMNWRVVGFQIKEIELSNEITKRMNTIYVYIYINFIACIYIIVFVFLNIYHCISTSFV